MENKLIQYAKAFLSENYDMELRIPIKLNGRLSITLGRFKHNKTESMEIDLSRKFVELNPFEQVLEVLYHELIHYARFEKGLTYHDGDPGFERDCARFGATSSGATNKHLRMTRTTEAQGGRFVIYKCSECGKEIERSRRLPKTRKYTHGSCTATLVEDRVEIRKG